VRKLLVAALQVGRAVDLDRAVHATRRVLDVDVDDVRLPQVEVEPGEVIDL
jgi:hypothetical protein